MRENLICTCCVFTVWSACFEEDEEAIPAVSRTSQQL